MAYPLYRRVRLREYATKSACIPLFVRALGPRIARYVFIADDASGARFAPGRGVLR
jgi:hypothetical protein